MKIEIFDVEHGQCSLITADNGAHMLIDAGHNTTTGWRPSRMLAARQIRHLETLVVTNCDEDHASDLANVREQVSIGALGRTPTLNRGNLTELKGQDQCGRGILSLMEMMDGYKAPPPPHPFGTLSFTLFSNAYPGFEDENNLSTVCIVEDHGLKMVFPGDMEVSGWRALLQLEDFRAALAGTQILMASHHGRWNGCCEELFAVAGFKPSIVIISDSGIQYASQDTVNWYRARVPGIEFYGDRRRVFTTRRDGAMTITVDAQTGANITTARQYATA